MVSKNSALAAVVLGRGCRTSSVRVLLLAQQHPSLIRWTQGEAAKEYELARRRHAAGTYWLYIDPPKVNLCIWWSRSSNSYCRALSDVCGIYHWAITLRRFFTIWCGGHFPTMCQTFLRPHVTFEGRFLIIPTTDLVSCPSPGCKQFEIVRGKIKTANTPATVRLNLLDPKRNCLIIPYSSSSTRCACDPHRLRCGICSTPPASNCARCLGIYSSSSWPHLRCRHTPGPQKLIKVDEGIFRPGSGWGRRSSHL